MMRRAELRADGVPPDVTTADLLVLREATRLSPVPQTPGDNPLEFEPFAARMKEDDVGREALRDALNVLWSPNLSTRTIGSGIPIRLCLN